MTRVPNHCDFELNVANTSDPENPLVFANNFCQCPSLNKIRHLVSNNQHIRNHLNEHKCVVIRSDSRLHYIFTDGDPHHCSTLNNFTLDLTLQVVESDTERLVRVVRSFDSIDDSYLLGEIVCGSNETIGSVKQQLATTLGIPIDVLSTKLGQSEIYTTNVPMETLSKKSLRCVEPIPVQTTIFIKKSVDRLHDISLIEFDRCTSSIERAMYWGYTLCVDPTKNNGNEVKTKSRFRFLDPSFNDVISRYMIFQNKRSITRALLTLLSQTTAPDDSHVSALFMPSFRRRQDDPNFIEILSIHEELGSQSSYLGIDSRLWSKLKLSWSIMCQLEMVNQSGIDLLKQGRYSGKVFSDDGTIDVVDWAVDIDHFHEQSLDHTSIDMLTSIVENREEGRNLSGLEWDIIVCGARYFKNKQQTYELFQQVFHTDLNIWDKERRHYDTYKIDTKTHIEDLNMIGSLSSPSKISFDSGRLIGPVKPLARSPPQGRQRTGGLRLGEIERDAVISHGLSSSLRDFHRTKYTVNDQIDADFYRGLSSVAVRDFYRTRCANDNNLMDIDPTTGDYRNSDMEDVGML